MPAVIERVDDGGRSIAVRSDDGEGLAFTLNRATGHFVEDGQLAGARLRFERQETE